MMRMPPGGKIYSALAPYGARLGPMAGKPMPAPYPVPQPVAGKPMPMPLPAPTPHLTPDHLQGGPGSGGFGEFMRRMQAMQMAEGMRQRLQPRPY
jgi:hypothetical protein